MEKVTNGLNKSLVQDGDVKKQSPVVVLGSQTARKVVLMMHMHCSQMGPLFTIFGSP